MKPRDFSFWTASLVLLAAFAPRAQAQICLPLMPCPDKCRVFAQLGKERRCVIGPVDPLVTILYRRERLGRHPNRAMELEVLFVRLVRLFVVGHWNHELAHEVDMEILRPPVVLASAPLEQEHITVFFERNDPVCTDFGIETETGPADVKNGGNLWVDPNGCQVPLQRCLAFRKLHWKNSPPSAIFLRLARRVSLRLL